jgi:hypothetical protein
MSVMFSIIIPSGLFDCQSDKAQRMCEMERSAVASGRECASAIYTAVIIREGG